MDYWSKSMGFYLALGGTAFYLFGVFVFLGVDSITVPYVLDRIIKRVKRLELKGFKQKEPKKLTVYRDEKGKIVFIRHDVKKKEEQNQEEKEEKDEKDAVIDLKDEQKKLQKKFNDEENVAEQFLTPAKTKKLKGKKSKVQDGDEGNTSNAKLLGASTTNKKKFKNDFDEVAEVLDEGKGKKKGKKGSKDEVEEEEKDDGKKKKKEKKDFEEVGDGGYINENGEWIEGKPEDEEDENAEEEEEEEEVEEDPEVVAARKLKEQEEHEKQMLEKFEEEKEVMEFVKQHGTSSSEEDKAEKNRNKEQKLYLKLEKRAKERYWYNLKSLIVHGNGLFSLLFITSLLMPRHVRFTLFYTNVMLNFFWCAIIIKNSQ